MSGQLWKPPGAEQQAMQMVPIQHRPDFPLSQPAVAGVSMPNGQAQILVLGGMSQVLHVAAIIASGMGAIEGDAVAVAQSVRRARMLIDECAKITAPKTE